MNLSQKDELLLYCLLVVQDKANDARLETLSTADWDAIIEDSDRSGVAPLLYHRIKTFHSDIPVPASVMERLRHRYLQSAGRGMNLVHDLGKLLGQFRRDDISVIVLKGVYLAAAVYRNIALRPMNDIDLLVKQADLLRVQEILVEQGYSASKEEIGSCGRAHLPPYRKKGSLAVEIHYHIVYPPISLRIDVEKLWVRAQMYSIQGIGVLTFCPEDLLLYLCVHAGIHHTFDNGIRSLFDISHTIEHYAEELDWKQLLDRSKEWGVGKCVYLSFFLAKQFAGASIPGPIMKDLDVFNESFHAAAYAEELIFGKATSVVPANVAKLFNNDSLLNRLVYVFKRAFPPQNILANMRLMARKPLSAYSLYSLYFIRIKNLLKKHIKTVWGLFFRDREMSTLAIFENKRNLLKDWLTQTD